MRVQFDHIIFVCGTRKARQNPKSPLIIELEVSE